jgi:hypothetical protein
LQLKLSNSQRGVITEMLNELRDDPSIGQPVPIPLGGPFFVEIYIGKRLWATVHYDIRKYRNDTTVYITGVRIGYKM